MRKITLTAILLMLSSLAFASEMSDRDAVETASMNYIEGFYEGDTSKLKSCLIPGLNKHGFWKNKGKDKYSFDAPEIKSEDSWNTLRNELLTNTETFAKHIYSMSEEQLESIFVNEKYGSFRRNIEGLIEHSYYHFGQLSLIKKND